MKTLHWTAMSVGLCALMPSLASAQDFTGAKDIFGIGTGNRGRGSVFYGKRKDTLGFQIGAYNNIDLDQNQLSSGPPSNDAQYLGGYRTAPGFGTDLLYFPGTDRQSVYFGLGLYYEGITDVARSPSTGFLYEVGRRNIWKTGYSVGLHASIGNTSDFVLGYHNLLGWNIGFTSRH